MILMHVKFTQAGNSQRDKTLCWNGEMIRRIDYGNKLHGFKSWAHRLLCDLLQVIESPCKHVSQRVSVRVK